MIFSVKCLEGADRVSNSLLEVVMILVDSIKNNLVVASDKVDNNAKDFRINNMVGKIRKRKKKMNNF